MHEYKVYPAPPSNYFIVLKSGHHHEGKIFEWASWGKSGSNFIRSVDGLMFIKSKVKFITGPQRLKTGIGQ